MTLSRSTSPRVTRKERVMTVYTGVCSKNGRRRWRRNLRTCSSARARNGRWISLPFFEARARMRLCLLLICIRVWRHRPNFCGKLLRSQFFAEVLWLCYLFSQVLFWIRYVLWDKSRRVLLHHARWRSPDKVDSLMVCFGRFCSGIFQHHRKHRIHDDFLFGRNHTCHNAQTPVCQPSTSPDVQYRPSKASFRFFHNILRNVNSTFKFNYPSARDVEPVLFPNLLWMFFLFPCIFLLQWRHILISKEKYPTDNYSGTGLNRFSLGACTKCTLVWSVRIFLCISHS